jgi:hypothetical protein
VVKPDSINFEGLALHPTRYAEHDEGDGAIAFTIEAPLAPDETEALRELQVAGRDASGRYWPVTREGVEEEPRRMRLGRVLWQRDGDQILHNITLVDEDVDTRDPNAGMAMLGGEPALGHVVKLASSLKGAVDALIAELEAGGALSAEAVERIRVAGADAVEELRPEFDEVDDLSRWWLD